MFMSDCSNCTWGDKEGKKKPFSLGIWRKQKGVGGCRVSHTQKSI